MAADAKQTPDDRSAGMNRGGRPKGSQNKVGVSVKNMIMGALEAKGGQAYLEWLADKEPKAFTTLVSKVIPTQLTVEGHITLEQLIQASDDD